LGASAQKRAAAVPGKKPIERTLPLKEIDYHFCVAVEASHNAEVHNLPESADQEQCTDEP
jgi:hypothetical protein